MSTSTGSSFAKHSDAIFLETSAKDSINITELFNAIGEHTPTDLHCPIPWPQPWEVRVTGGLCG